MFEGISVRRWEPKYKHAHCFMTCMYTIIWIHWSQR